MIGNLVQPFLYNYTNILPTKRLSPCVHPRTDRQTHRPTTQLAATIPDREIAARTRRNAAQLVTARPPSAFRRGGSGFIAGPAGAPHPGW